MLIQKMNNAIKGIMTMTITDQIQKTLENTFDEIKNKENWKYPTNPEYMTFTFGNYELLIQKIGLIAMSFNHFHGGYELSRIGDSDTVKIYSKGYDHYDIYSCKCKEFKGWFPVGETAICGKCSLVIDGDKGEKLINDYIGTTDAQIMNEDSSLHNPDW